LILSEKGELSLVKAAEDRFSPLAKSQILGGKCWSVPVLANGHVYCRNAQGDVVCVKFD
jgi:hypothetical protein